MDNKELLHKILNNIKGLDISADNFIKYSKIPQIEIDLLLSKVRNLYDDILLLERVNRLYTIEGKAGVSETFELEETEEGFLLEDDILEEDVEIESKELAIESSLIESSDTKDNVVEEVKSKKERENGNAQKTSEHKETIHKQDVKVKVEETEITETLEKSDIKDISLEQERIDESIESFDVEDTKKQKTTSPEVNTDDNEEANLAQETTEVEREIKKKEVVTSVQEETRSINDMINANQSGNVLANKLKQKPIANINTAIGLNDKFQFIRELFGGLSDEYSKTVEVLNNLSSFEEAREYIDKRFDWDEDDSVVVKFLEVVNRRYL